MSSIHATGMSPFNPAERLASATPLFKEALPSQPTHKNLVDAKYTSSMPSIQEAEDKTLALKVLFAERVAELENVNNLDKCKEFWEGHSEYGNLRDLVESFSEDKMINVAGGREWFLGTLHRVNQLADKNKKGATIQKLSGHFGAFPLVLQNPPHKRRQETICGQTVTALRHPAPTSSYKKEDWLKSYKSLIAIIKGIFHAIFQSKQYVMSSFKQYVKKLNEENKDYLYVNFQSIKKKGKGDVEHKRTKALEKFGNKNANFYFFSQVMDGEFFKKAPSVTSMDGVTAYLQNEIIDGNYGRIDYKKLGLTKEQCQEKIKKHVELMQNLFFKDIDDVKKNWTAFLLIFYTLERLDWKTELAKKENRQGFVYLTACKDFQDRGNFCAALLDEILLATLTNKIGPGADENEENIFLNDLIIHTVGVPLRSKGQGIITSRLKQGSAALKRLLTLDKSQIEQIKQAFFVEKKGPADYDIMMDKEEEK